MTEVEVEAPPEEQTEDQGTIMEGIEIIEGGGRGDRRGGDGDRGGDRRDGGLSSRR